jgi:hypothetical protein
MDSAFCGLHNDKYIKFQSIGNCRLSCLYIEKMELLRISDSNIKKIIKL